MKAFMTRCLSNDTRTIWRGRSVRRTMRPSIDGGSQIKPPMPHQFVRKYSALCGKLTRPASILVQAPPCIAAQRAAMKYPGPLKIGMIEQKCLGALRPPAAAARGQIIVAGVRKPAQYLHNRRH